jgi:hypothetical protein
MKTLKLKPTHKAVKTYYNELQQLSLLDADKEDAVSPAFADLHSGIVNDPNRADEPDYIVNLIQRVITLSVETVKIVKGLPDLEEVTEEET